MILKDGINYDDDFAAEYNCDFVDNETVDEKAEYLQEQSSLRRELSYIFENLLRGAERSPALDASIEDAIEDFRNLLGAYNELPLFLDNDQFRDLQVSELRETTKWALKVRDESKAELKKWVLRTQEAEAYAAAMREFLISIVPPADDPDINPMVVR